MSATSSTSTIANVAVPSTSAIPTGADGLTSPIQSVIPSSSPSPFTEDELNLDFASEEETNKRVADFLHQIELEKDMPRVVANARREWTILNEEDFESLDAAIAAGEYDYFIHRNSLPQSTISSLLTLDANGGIAAIAVVCMFLVGVGRFLYGKRRIGESSGTLV